MIHKCPGPDCSKTVGPDSKHPDFCSHPCAVAWRDLHIDTEATPDGGLGRVKGACYGSAPSERNNGLNALPFAFPWLDARAEAT